jgi:hypothetical protein
MPVLIRIPTQLAIVPAIVGGGVAFSITTD